MTVVNYSKCNCGAITLYMDNGDDYSLKQRNLKQFFYSLDLRELKAVKLQDTYCCNHCVNGYGLDLCACGSKKAPHLCKEGFPCCGQPMQIAGGRTTVYGGWKAGFNPENQC